ncbi:MAG: hypothetical protein HZA20_02920 [Nitrospirae bacterium]|nr:hypothetical protein [Nitrospirota bacterium]
MSILAKILGAGDVVKSVGDTLDNLFTSDEERAEKQNELAKAELQFRTLEAQLTANQNIAQTEVNKVEAASASLFVAGWRPAIGWIGAIALAYQFILYPLLLWLPQVKNPPKPLESDMLMTIITGMLGIAGMRSYDKMKGTDTQAMGKK